MAWQSSAIRSCIGRVGVDVKRGGSSFEHDFAIESQRACARLLETRMSIVVDPTPKSHRTREPWVVIKSTVRGCVRTSFVYLLKPRGHPEESRDTAFMFRQVVLVLGFFRHGNRYEPKKNEYAWDADRDGPARGPKADGLPDSNQLTPRA